MFKNRLSSGKHMICDIHDIKNINLLNNKELLKDLLKNICIKYNFEILGELDYSFNPQGCTILFLLSESHISIHTFPEKNHISFDIYTCREYNSNNEYNEIYLYLIESLNAYKNSECKIIERNFNNKIKTTEIYIDDLFDIFTPIES